MQGMTRAVTALVIFYVGCAEPAPSTSPHNFEIRTAPLNLPGIDFACYDLLVENGAATPETVISRGTVGQRLADGDTTTLCSTQFGNGPGGDISYVAPCDAQLANHTVTLWVDGVYTGTPAAPELVEYQDPCPSGCTLSALCAENADTPVTFDLTIMRPANQGFFDLAVNFDNIFCSAKVDCEYGPGDPIELLFHPATGERGQTVVLGLACTAGPGADFETVLFRDPIVVTCNGFDPIVLDPTLGEGNVYGPVMADPNLADPIWQYATYFGDEALDCGGVSCNKRYWNVAIGFDPTAAGCSLTTTATAANAGAMQAFETPEASTYPLIDVDVALTGDAGSLVCSRHPLNAAPTGVSTRYTPLDAPETFCHLLGSAGVATNPDADACPEAVPPLAFGWFSLSPYYSLDPSYEYTLGLSDIDRVNLWRQPLVEAAANGWDFVMRYGASNPIYAYDLGGDTYDLIRFLDDAETLGVRVLVDLERTGAVPTPTIIDEVVVAVRDHPAVYGYYLIDEPELRPDPPFNVTVAEAIDAYTQVKTLDPDRPVVISMSAPIADHTGFLAAGDIIAKQLYSPGHWDSIETDIATVRAANKPFLIVPRVYVGEALYAQTLPSPEQFQFNVLMPIAMGALQGPGGGIFPFIFEGYQGGNTAPPSETGFRDSVVYPNGELLRAMEPYLRAGTPTGPAFEWVQAPGTQDDFRAIVLGGRQEDLILIVAHRGASGATVSFRVSGLPAGTSVATRLDGEAALVLAPDGTLPTQTFAPGEVRVYRLASYACDVRVPCRIPLAASDITPSFSLLSGEEADIGRLVDGDITTAFGFGAGPPASLLIDLGTARNLESIELVVLQSPYGDTRHEIETGLALDTMATTAVLEQYTSTYDVLVADLGGASARYVLVTTVSSPSWVAWMELSIFGDL